MGEPLYSSKTKFQVGFFDVDPMNVVWHGNYVKYLEVGRCALLDEIGYNYNAMVEDGFAFPVVEVRLKYIKPLVFNETATITSSIVEYENCLKIKYEIHNEKGELATKAMSNQMVVKMASGETQFACPKRFIENVQNAIATKSGGDQ